MAGEMWVIGEVTGAGTLTKLSGEAATAARALGETGRHAVVGVVVAEEPDKAAESLAAFLPNVHMVRAPEASGRPAAAVVAARVVALAASTDPRPAYFLLGATPDGRDVAGMLAALLGIGVLANVTSVAWGDATADVPEGPRVEAQPWGGRLQTRSAFTADTGIILLRPNMVTAAALATPGRVAEGIPGGVAEVPLVRVVERVAVESAGPSIEEARVIVTGGRGVGGPGGFAALGELAALLGGAVGATRAAVDAGWAPYATQIGQTGKTVKPTLYLGCGVSGAIQHKVGMQTAETIVAINSDPDAPIAEFADLFVIADQAAVVAALTAALRARAG